MTSKRRLTGDDACKVACPGGPPPECPKMACQRAVQSFDKDIAPEEPAKKAKKSTGGNP